MNHTCLCLPSQSWYSFTDPGGIVAELALGGWLVTWVAGWLHTEINVRHRELNADTVTHLSTNRARSRLTSLIEANALTTTPNRQPSRFSAGALRYSKALHGVFGYGGSNGVTAIFIT